MATIQTSEGLQVRALEVSDLCVTATGAANVATTIVMPVPGAAVLWRATVTYFAKAGI